MELMEGSLNKNYECHQIVLKCWERVLCDLPVIARYQNDVQQLANLPNRRWIRWPPRSHACAHEIPNANSHNRGLRNVGQQVGESLAPNGIGELLPNAKVYNGVDMTTITPIKQHSLLLYTMSNDTTMKIRNFITRTLCFFF